MFIFVGAFSFGIWFAHLLCLAFWFYRSGTQVLFTVSLVTYVLHTARRFRIESGKIPVLGEVELFSFLEGLSFGWFVSQMDGTVWHLISQNRHSGQVQDHCLGCFSVCAFKIYVGIFVSLVFFLCLDSRITLVILSTLRVWVQISRFLEFHCVHTEDWEFFSLCFSIRPCTWFRVHGNMSQTKTPTWSQHQMSFTPYETCLIDVRQLVIKSAEDGNLLILKARKWPRLLD